MIKKVLLVETLVVLRTWIPDQQLVKVKQRRARTLYLLTKHDYCGKTGNEILVPLPLRSYVHERNYDKTAILEHSKYL